MYNLQLKHDLNKHHPRAKIKTEKGSTYVPHSVQHSETGRHYLFGSGGVSDFSKYGLGVELYFKFMVCVQ